MPKQFEYETYGEKEEKTKSKGIIDIAKAWIKEKQDKKKEDIDFKESIRQVAKEEAKVEVVPILKEQYKQEEIDRYTGKNKGDLMEKFRKGLSGGDGNFIASNEKLNKMLGKTSTNTEDKKKGSMIGGSNGVLSNDKLLDIMGRNKDKIKEEKYSSGVSNDDILSKMSITGNKKKNSDAINNDKITNTMKINKEKNNSDVVNDNKIKNLMVTKKEKTTEDRLKLMLGKK